MGGCLCGCFDIHTYRDTVDCLDLCFGLLFTVKDLWGECIMHPFFLSPVGDLLDGIG